MFRITAIHHPLGNVDSGAGNVRPTAHIHDPADRAAVHSHAQLEFRMLLYRAADLQGTFHRRFRCAVKHQSHSIAGRNRNQPMIRVGFTELLSATNKLVQQLKQASLLINQELGVAHNVGEEHISNLQLDLFLNLGRHGDKFYSVTTKGSTLFFRRERGDDFLEARIAAQRIPIRQQF